ncbi:hypothetical protein BH11PSE10_BH11PSE10_02860 [soil metagenome]
MAGSDSQRPAEATLKRMERWTWSLILPGLLALVLGIFLLRGATDGELLGYGLASLGGLAVLTGIVLILLRSRWS